MDIPKTIQSGLRAIFRCVSELVDLREMTPEEVLKQSIGFQIKDLNDFSRKNRLGIKVTRKGQGIDGLDSNVLRLLVEVPHSKVEFSFRKLVADIDLTNTDTVEAGLRKLKAIYFHEVGQMRPDALPALTQEIGPH